MSLDNPLLDAAKLTARAIEELQRDNAAMRVTIAALETRLDEYKQINQTLFEQSNKASIERDYFMRECAILSTRLSDLSALAQTALDDHRHAPYRRNGSAPEGVQKAVAEANQKQIPEAAVANKAEETAIVEDQQQKQQGSEVVEGDAEPIPAFLNKGPAVVSLPDRRETPTDPPRRSGLTAADAEAERVNDPVDAQVQRSNSIFGAPKNGNGRKLK